MNDAGKIILATKLGGRTCVGVRLGEYPLKHGNCFDMKDEDGDTYRILNFAAENMDELIRRGLTFPIKIKIIGGTLAVIHDERISEKWYQSRICEVCCPSSLLPWNQQNAHERQQASGARKDLGNGWIMTGPVITPQF